MSDVNHEVKSSSTKYVALILFLAGIGTFIFAEVVFNNQSSQPQYAGEAGWGPVVEFLMTVIFVVVPLMLAALIVVIVGMVRNHRNRRNQDASAIELSTE